MGKDSEVKTRLRNLINQATSMRPEFSEFQSILLQSGVVIEVSKPRSNSQGESSISYVIDGKKISGYHLGENCRYTLYGLTHHFGVQKDTLLNSLLTSDPDGSTKEETSTYPLRITQDNKNFVIAASIQFGSIQKYLTSLILRDKSDRSNLIDQA
jgi:hypothetical protein